MRRIASPSDPPPPPGSDEDTGAAVTPDDEDFTRLTSQVELSLRVGRLPEATAAVAELLARWPDSTTTHELAGDVAAAEGKMAQARQHYKRALEVEPANADAERKYGAALLTPTVDERRLELLNHMAGDPVAGRAAVRRPLNAVLNALLFPGIGQLYNREQEKGLIILAAAAVALGVLLSIVMPYASASFTINSPNARDAQIRSAQTVISETGPTQWLIVTLCGLVYLALYLWGIFDAWKYARAQSEPDLGL